MVRARGVPEKTIHYEEREYEVGNAGGQFQLWSWTEDITSKMQTPEAQEPMGEQMDEPIGFFGKDDASDMLAEFETKPRRGDASEEQMQAWLEEMRQGGYFHDDGKEL